MSVEVQPKPLVSVITVVYNSIATLEQTIKSVINQSYSNVEYIIIDGGSTDGSIELIQKYEGHIAFWISEPDQGIYYAMNKGLKHAKGSLISLLNSDDWYEPHAIEAIVQAFQTHPQVDIYHALLRFVSDNDRFESVAGHYHTFLDRGMIEHPTCFIKKSLYDRVGSFDTAYRSAADFEWMQRARSVQANFHLVTTLITNFRVGGMSASIKGSVEELEIKYKYRLISPARYVFWKMYFQLMSFKKAIG